MKLEISELPPVFRDVFKFAQEIFATDIYIREGVPAFFKIVGYSGTAVGLTNFIYSTWEGFEPEELEKRRTQRIKELPVSLKQKVVKGDINSFLESLELRDFRSEVDTSFAVYEKGKFQGRFRLNVASSDGSVVLSMRRLYSYVPHYEEDLRLPEVIGEIPEWNSGLVIVTGPTGSGKSTTLASIMRLLSEDASKPRVIITIEKPIEYVFENKNSFFIQREVGKDTESFVSGVNNALRQHPDVIYVGESRTPDEIKATLMASETGHLTFTTLHTSSAWGVISRIVDVFPPDEQPQIRTILADQLKLVIAQRLFYTVDQAVRAVTEILYVDDYVRQRIREGDVKAIRDYMQKEGNKCTLLNRELVRLVKEEVMTPEMAIKVAYDVKSLKASLGVM